MDLMIHKAAIMSQHHLLNAHSTFHGESEHGLNVAVTRAREFGVLGGQAARTWDVVRASGFFEQE